MGLIARLVGTPPNHEQEKQTSAVVAAPEFDITQYAKKLAVVIGVLMPAIIAALKLFKVKQITPGIVIGALAVTAVALLSVSLVMAVDVAARAYLTRGQAEKKAEDPSPGSASSQLGLVAAPPGTLVWLDGEEEPHPVLAIAGDGTTASSYLVASGLELERPFGTGEVSALDGAPEWHSADQVKACRVPVN